MILNSVNKKTNESKDSHVIKINMYRTNTYQLGELFGIDSLDILKRLQTLSNAFITDEF